MFSLHPEGQERAGHTTIEEYTGANPLRDDRYINDIFRIIRQ